MLEKQIKELDNNSFRLEYFDKYKDLEVPFWNRINVKGEKIESYVDFKNKRILNNSQEGVEILKISDIKTKVDYDESRFAIDDFYKYQVYAFSNDSMYIKIKEGVEVDNPIYIEYDFDKVNNTLLDLIVIEVGKNAKANIIIKYKSLSDDKMYKNSVIKVIADEYSELNLSRIQNLNTNSVNYDFSDFNLADNANVKYYTVEFGCDVNVVSSTAYLNGYNSNIETLPAYLADGKRKVDLAYSVIFRGKHTNGQINGNGAVLGNSTKVFRGNIYFERGSSKSVGREGSFDMLLSDNINAHSIPTLFCDEDDVIGEHYSSVGKIDEARLMYLMSRGISEQSAKKLIVESSFRPIIDGINDEVTREELINELDSRI